MGVLNPLPAYHPPLTCSPRWHPWPCPPISSPPLQVCALNTEIVFIKCVLSLTLFCSAPDEQPMEGSVPDAGAQDAQQTNATVPQVHTHLPAQQLHIIHVHYIECVFPSRCLIRMRCLPAQRERSQERSDLPLIFHILPLRSHLSYPALSLINAYY